ncbi:MAG: rhomboid family intramembrane serine protease, partial [Dehalococcoidia bacterium]
ARSDRLGRVALEDVRDVYEGGPPTVWLTLLTTMFIHGGWMHLLGNMLFLWVFGDNVEDRLGRVKYLLFYIITGLFASAAQLLVNFNSGIPAIGASGAIAGVLGAYFLLFPTSQIRTVIFFFLITIISLPAYLLIGIWILLQFFSAVAGSLGGTFAGGVAYWAHVGGFAAGFLIIAAFLGVSGVRERFRRRFRGPPPGWNW